MSERAYQIQLQKGDAHAATVIAQPEEKKLGFRFSFCAKRLESNSLVPLWG
jgi:hypothetical protein